MQRIQKAPETMTARERVRRIFEFEKTDRVTIGYEANAAIHARLCRELGVANDDMESVYQALGVDYRGVSAPYVGPGAVQGSARAPGGSAGGLRHALGRPRDGRLLGFLRFSLEGADDADFDAFPVPNPDDFDYDQVREQAKSYGGQYALYIGSAGVPDVINSNGRIMGMEDVLCHLLMKDEAAMRFIERRAAFQLEMLSRLADALGDMLDFVWLGEDLGTQHTPMISLDLYRETLRPIHQRFVDLAKAQQRARHVPHLWFVQLGL